MTTLLWFKQDLRLHDNTLLADLDLTQPCLPVYCLDPAQFIADEHGMRRCGARRAQHLLASLDALDAGLRTLGSPGLLLLQQAPEQALPQLCRELNVGLLRTHSEYAPEELKRLQQIAGQLPDHCRLQQVQDNRLFALESLPFSLERMPQVFTRFRNQIERQLPEPSESRARQRMGPWPRVAINLRQAWPTLSQLGLEQPVAEPRSALPPGAGEAAALDWLNQYLWRDRSVRHYKETRNGLLGRDFSSKLSPWLAHGSLSVRHVWRELRRHEAEHGANDSTYWLGFELLWREFFRLSLQQHGAAWFRLRGLSEHKPCAHRDERFEQWRNGRTGNDFVDACLHELNGSGFLSNRGRQIAASYLVHELQQDWRLGAAWFEQQLIDYEVGSNWGNWAYIAGVGHDPRGGRRFNVQEQATRHDPEGAYVHTWLAAP
ncbi:DASH family cryptochrome [Halopseudomonas salegens]|uniref:Cryptochrome DASH n=1 Tax=Halopseudomonas salegens TaxID=1434072 RepID=A0A1H2HWP2_9GAMM|nr:DASH family cryptochrome [Halopseudomonas salegens]SDU36311.1 deoxyribodipyrimidine photo-lyase (single-stranded DNA-specific) [Halopseudomonas salegens]